MKNKLKNIFNILKTNLINLRLTLNLEDNGLKFRPDITPFLHRNTSFSILIQVATSISLGFYMEKWISIKIYCDFCRNQLSDNR